MALMALGLMATAVAGAQNCETLVLPFFGGDVARMASYPEEKLEWRCRYARNAFYESDTVPAGVEVFGIAEVVEKATGMNLPADFKVDLSRLSYYAYNFYDFQTRYRRGNVTVCFSTPGSAHPYLVLRSIDETHRRASQPEVYGY